MRDSIQGSVSQVMVGHCFTGGAFIDVPSLCGPGAKPPHCEITVFFRGFLFI